MPTTDPRHRKAIRAAGQDLHRLATAMRRREGHLPDDGPAYLDAFSAALRRMARLCDAAKGATCAEIKREALAMAAVGDDDVSLLAHQRAANALLVTVNPHAIRAGLDPYERMRP